MRGAMQLYIPIFVYAGQADGGQADGEVKSPNNVSW